LIVLELNKGTLTIESDADDIRVRITRGDEVINELKVTKSGQSVRVAAGQYNVEIIGETDDLTVENKQVTLHRAGTEVVRIVHNADNHASNRATPKNLSAAASLDKLQTTPEDEKAKDEAAKAWLRRPVVGKTLDGKSFQLTGHDALMDCVMRNNAESLNRLLTMDKYDLDLSIRDGQWTLLQIALLHNCVETTSLLLRHGADPNFASKGTPQPLELAQRSGRKELVVLVQKYLEGRALNPQNKINEFEASNAIQKSVDALVEVSFSGTTDGTSISASGIGWMVDDQGHVLLPSHVVPECDDEAIQLRYTTGVRCSARRLKTLGDSKWD
jgi:hypothetical protein